MKKIPLRSCVVTREKCPKADLIRIVNTSTGVIYDETGKVNGHGCYLKKDVEVINMAKTKKILNHVLKTEVPDSFYDTLIDKLK